MNSFSNMFPSLSLSFWSSCLVLPRPLCACFGLFQGYPGCCAEPNSNLAIQCGRRRIAGIPRSHCAKDQSAAKDNARQGRRGHSEAAGNMHEFDQNIGGGGRNALTGHHRGLCDGAEQNVISVSGPKYHRRAAYGEPTRSRCSGRRR